MRESILKKVLLLILVYGLANFMPAMANEIALLNGIEISNNKNGVYQITLQADSQIPVDKKISSRDKVVLELKNTQAAGSINTIYNNTSGIDHVIVQPTSNKNIRILIKGQDIASSFVTVNTDMLPMGLGASKTANNTSETLTLNKSIESYSPVIEPDVTTEQAVAPIKESTGASLITAIKSFLATISPSWFMTIMMMMFFVFVTLKNSNNQPARRNVNIDLSSGLQNREMDMYRDLVRKEGIIGNNSPASLGKKPQINPRANYGLKEYQNSQVNPTKNMTNFSKVNNANAYKKPQDLRNDTRNPIAKQAQAQQPNLNKDISRKDVAKAKNTINSMKFLESMADIYEKSGRVDLANGLHDKMRKAQLMK